MYSINPKKILFKVLNKYGYFRTEVDANLHNDLNIFNN